MSEVGSSSKLNTMYWVTTRMTTVTVMLKARWNEYSSWIPDNGLNGESSDAVRDARSSCRMVSPLDLGVLHGHELQGRCTRHHAESGCRR